MKLLIDVETIKINKSIKKIPLECEQCEKVFYKDRKTVLKGIKGTKKVSFCSVSCSCKSRQKHENITKPCKECQILFTRRATLKVPDPQFCCHDCANIYIGRNTTEEIRQNRSNFMSSNSKLRKSSEKTRQKRILIAEEKYKQLSKKCLCVICGNSVSPEYKGNNNALARKKTCSKYCRAELQSRIMKRREVIGGNKNKYATGWHNSPSAGRVWLESSYEKIVAKDLDLNNIRWIRPKYLKWIDSKNESHKYFPDFYLIDFNIFLDPKNDFIILRDQDKIDRVINQNKVKLFLLRKSELSWNSIKLKIDSQ